MRHVIFIAVLSAGLASCSGGSDGPQVRPGDSDGGGGDVDPVLLVLGDSLSDTGNAAALADYLLGEEIGGTATTGLCHPGERLILELDCIDIIFERSRVSNGPVAVEYLAERLGTAPLAPSFHTVPNRPAVGVNYAVAGAKARDSSPRDLGHQIERVLLDHGPALPPESAIVLMIGGNDAIDALQAAVLPNLTDPADGLPGGSPETPPPASGAEPDPIVAQAVDGIVIAATRLLEMDACVIVANVPNLARLPAVRTTAEAEGVDIAAATAAAEEVTLGFNTLLAERLAELGASHPNGASLVPFDLFASFEAALDDAAVAGLNVTDACFDSETYTGSTVGEREFHPDCAPAPGQAPRFDQFFFWDGIHPSGVAHAALGAALVETYDRECAAAAAASAR